jgi:hypothetical protein
MPRMRVRTSISFLTMASASSMVVACERADRDCREEKRELVLAPGVLYGARGGKQLSPVSSRPSW